MRKIPATPEPYPMPAARAVSEAAPGIAILPRLAALGPSWVAMYKRAVLDGSSEMRRFILRFAFASEEQRLVMAEIVEKVCEERGVNLNQEEVHHG